MAESSATTTNRSQTRRKAAATDRSTAAKKAAATRARNQATEARKRSTAAKKAAETRRELQRTPVEHYIDFAGRAVTIPVGAALVARDNVVELATKYDSLDKVQRELSKFERRGTVARDRFERELGNRRERVERDLRGLRTARRDAGAQATLVSSRVENLVQTGITAGTQVAAKAVERVARVEKQPPAQSSASPPLGTERPGASDRLPASYLAGSGSTSPPRERVALGRLVLFWARPRRARPPVCQNGSHAHP